HAEWRGRVRYVQIAVPSRTKVEAYAGFRREVEEIVGRINGAYSTAEQAPIHYVGRGFDDRELAALYRAADVCLVTPLRDGMNLVAKEFVASRVDDDGVLVLSEFAGASAELGEALPVNPYDIDGAAETIGRALTMPRDERAARMRALRRRVALGDVDRWARNFLTSLDAAAVSPRGPARQARMRDAEQLSTLFASAPKLILFLDYDGTLVPFASTPELATPDAGLIRLMYDLVAAAGVELHLISGRSRGDLERWFGTLPVGIHAEHGLWTRPVGAAEWASVSRPDVSWKDRLKPYLEQVTASTPGSLLEEKTAGFAWHWRRADPEYGALQARELRLHLNDLLSNTPVEVFTGEKVVEVRPQVANKGVIVGRVLAETPEPYLAAAIGDDRTDEDLFRALPPDGVAVRVGTGPTRAPHRLSDWTEVRRLLDAIVKLRPGPARAASATNMA
ncbi:MAG TPA: trehalose-phosphatase, partial [Planctomycetota bacterium]|nr:trehalose-phosphatase [Planctomycetota bacterium]